MLAQHRATVRLGYNGRMGLRRARPQGDAGPRHAFDWYDQSRELVPLDEGDRVFIACEGGPCASRLETFPPRLEIEERDGSYVLLDDGPRDTWRYLFVPRS
jgi:hypothetical protein